jgi:hypothetical protein
MPEKRIPDQCPPKIVNLPTEMPLQYEYLSQDPNVLPRNIPNNPLLYHRGQYQHTEEH